MPVTTTAAADPTAHPPSPLTKTKLSTEDQPGLSALLEDLTRRHAPQGAAEAHWVRQMALTMLRQGWADALERRVVKAALSGQPSPALPSASVLPRWRARIEKDFRQAARELAACKARRRTAAATGAPAGIDRRHPAELAKFDRDPQAALARLLAQQNPFDHNGTNESEPPARPLNRAQRRLEARQRAA